MKTRFFAILVCAAAFSGLRGFAQSDDEGTGWFNTGQEDLPGITVFDDSFHPPLLGGGTGNSGPDVAIAEATSPEIQTLARGLENDPHKIFDYVHDHIRYL